MKDCQSFRLPSTRPSTCSDGSMTERHTYTETIPKTVCRRSGAAQAPEARIPSPCVLSSRTSVIFFKKKPARPEPAVSAPTEQSVWFPSEKLCFARPHSRSPVLRLRVTNSVLIDIISAPFRSFGDQIKPLYRNCAFSLPFC